MVGRCSCGLFHSQSDSFCGLSSSSVMPAPAYYHKQVPSIDEAAATVGTTGMYSYSYYSSTSSVDCTLSLGTPSTRLGLGSSDMADGHHRQQQQQQKQATMAPAYQGSSCLSGFCWDFLQNNKHTSTTKPCANNNNGNSFDPPSSMLLARRCANCDTTSTPLWRNGPRGPKSLCNACGIRFKKEERRANAAAAAVGTTPANGAVASGFMEGQHNTSTWTQKLPSCLSPAIAHEFRFIDDDNRHSDTGISFLSWRLNVNDRPGLVHDFTR